MKLIEYKKKKLKICVIGGGYIGLPLAVAFVKKGIDVILYDINKNRIKSLRNNVDYNFETNQTDLKFLEYIKFTFNSKEIKNSNVYIVTAPTPVNKKK